jgi:catecholate siderophore receptor
MAVVQGVTTARAALSGSELVALNKNSPTALDAVVVEDTKTKPISSPKFTAPLRDTPQTVVVIQSEVYLQQGAASLSDVLRNTSGITFAAGEGGNANATSGDSFYMRGFDTTNNIFVDGVRDVGAYSRDVYNIEQVEVAKGPAGTDIGRGGAPSSRNNTQSRTTFPTTACPLRNCPAIFPLSPCRRWTGARSTVSPRTRIR